MTPVASPVVSSHDGWTFPDTEEGICSAVENGVTHFWANTILFSSHPLQTSAKLSHLADRLYIVGQPPSLVENFDDKAYLNGRLRETGGFTLPQFWLLDSTNTDRVVHEIQEFPIVGKPVRGRGSHGVRVCHDHDELRMHTQSLLNESPVVMLEQYLAGQEATITVMPPTPSHPRHWAMPPVTRFNHQDGIAPYNGVVAVTANSRVATQSELADPAYDKIMHEAAKVATLIGATAPIRIDVRRFSEGSDFALFDINMKPVCSSQDGCV